LFFFEKKNQKTSDALERGDESDSRCACNGESARADKSLFASFSTEKEGLPSCLSHPNPPPKS
jgi:hypothetical protein